MNLYLRLLWVLLRSRLRGRLGFAEVLVQHWRVLPTDLDVNGHMNNARYSGMLDLALVEFFGRTGFLRSLLSQGWRPMSGGTLMSFRRGLDPFQRYELRFSWICSDERWNYMAIEFRREGRLHAAGLMKGAAVSKQGLVPVAEYLRTFPASQHAELEQMLARPLTADVLAWRESEEALLRRVRGGEA